MIAPIMPPGPDETPSSADEATSELPLGTESTIAGQVLPPPAPTVEPPSATPPAADGGWRRFLAGVALGALVGGVAGGGVASVIGDDEPASTAAPTSLPSTLPQLEMPGNVTEIVQSVGPAVVSIQAEVPVGGFFGGSSTGEGSGFIASSDGIIVTNNHVIDGATQVTVHFADGESRRAEVLGTDPARDLAILDVDATGLPAVTLGSSAELRPGDTVVAIGNALGLGDTPTVTDGIVSALDREITVTGGRTLDGLLQTSAPINPGNSGGPLLNTRGEVVGINTAVAGGAENIGFAVPIDAVRDTVQRATDGDVARLAFLGVNTVPVTDELVTRFGLGTDSGALVVEVTTGTAADRAGIVAGDVIVALDGDAIDDPEGLGDAIATRAGGQDVVVTVIRDGERVEIDATLGERAGTLG